MDQPEVQLRSPPVLPQASLAQRVEEAQLQRSLLENFCGAGDILSPSKLKWSEGSHDETRVLQEIPCNFVDETRNRQLVPFSKSKSSEHEYAGDVSQPIAAEPEPPKHDQQQLCLVHNKVRDIVCTVDLELVCSNCAIFCHKGHDFKSLKDFHLDKLKHCQRLLELTDGKKNMQEQISGEKSQQKIQQQFEQLRSRLLQQIRNKFTLLNQAVREAEERCNQRVIKAVQQEQQRVRKLMAVPQSIDVSYRKWQETAYNELKCFDTKDLKVQMSILNYDGKEAVDTVNKGERLLQNLKKYQSLLEQKTASSFTSFTLEFDTDVEKKLATVHEAVLRKFKKKTAIGQQLTLDQNETLNASTILNQTVAFDDLLLDDNKPRESEDNPINDQSTLIGHHSSTYFIPQAPRTNRQLSILAGTVDGKDSLSTIFMGQLTMIGSPPTLRLGSSPMKDFGLPSPRYFVSPNKYRAEPVIDQRLKKALTRLKLPEKYYRMVVSTVTEPTEIFDLTNCGLDERTILAILELIRSNRSVKVLKLIRNRLTDEFLAGALPQMTNTMVLNISQNFLTDKALELLSAGLNQLPSLRTVILTQNRIRDRNWRQRVEQFKRQNVSVVL